MPYNFTATFTQPILLKLDNGLIGGAEDWAKTITKAYINTITSGLPVGVPPVLPAPGLNPTAPPPFSIGVSGISKASAQSREKAMYTVIHSYYFAKELGLNKASIDALLLTAKRIVLKIKNTQKRVKTTIEQIKIIKEELKELPKLLEEIIDAIKDTIQEQTFNVGTIETTFDSAKLELGPETFASVFSKELEFINAIKNFNPTNVAGIKAIAMFVAEQGTQLQTNMGDAKTKQLKDYVISKLIGIAKEFLTLANGILNPAQLISYVKNLAPVRPKMRVVLDKLKRFTILATLLNPQLKKLEKKKDELLKQIKVKLQQKIIAIQEKIKKRITEHAAKKKKNKSDELYKKAAEAKAKKVKEKTIKIKRTKKKIKLYIKASKSVATIVGKVTNLITSLDDEFKAIKQEIESAVATAQQAITSTTSLVSSEIESAKAKDYAASIGLQQFANQMVLIITQTKCDIQTFKTFFERSSSRITAYANEYDSIVEEVDTLVETIKSIQQLNKEAKAEKEGLPAPPKLVIITKKRKSLKSLIQSILNKLKPRIQKIGKAILDKIKQLGVSIKNKAKKSAEQEVAAAEKSIPTNSSIEDKKKKKEAAEAKKKKTEERKKQIQRQILLGSYVFKMAKNATTVVKNINASKYRLSDNEIPINGFLDGYYLYQKYEQPRTRVQELNKEKILFKERFQSLKLIEALTYGLIETIKDIRETDFAKDFKSIIQSTPKSTTLELIGKLIDNPPKTPKQVEEVLQALSGGVLQDMSIANNILALERKYLSRSREVIKTLCDVKQITNIKIRAGLQKIEKTLTKNQSFILLVFNMLKKELIAFKNFLAKKIENIIVKIKAYLAKKAEKKKKQSEEEAIKSAKKSTNLDAKIMSVVFGLATKVFWTGVTWVGPTNSNHVALTIGPFKAIKAKMEDGASGMIAEIASSFEKQLAAMSGLVIPPAATSIPPLSFNGYK